jgi:photosystem II stability/assembly factor-like uncharacterized protein
MMEKVMNFLGKNILALCTLLVIFMYGCDLVNKNQSTPNVNSLGRDLIVNEVFTISPDKYYAYSWIEIYNPTPRTILWFDQVYPANGSAVGAVGEVIHTTNSGVTWTDTLTNSALGTLRSLNFANYDTGFACGDGETIYKVTHSGLIDISGNIASRDASINLSSITNQSTYLTPVDGAFDRLNRYAYVVGDKGTILRTLLAGKTWLRVPTAGPPTKQNLRNIYSLFFKLYVVGDSGTFLISLNNGTNWTLKNYPQPYRGFNYYSNFFISDSLGWVAGDNGTILFTTNQGTSWTPETTYVNATLRGSFFGLVPSGQIPPIFSVGSGCVVGDNGTILHTQDFGATWRSVNSGTSARLNSVYFTDSLHGWAFGNGGVIVATTDGGGSWHSEQSGTTQNLYSGHFLGLKDTVQVNYYLAMQAQRNYIFIDKTTGTINPDFIVRTDTGTVLFAPYQSNLSIAPGGFAVITNDSLKFDEHTKMGPGKTTRLNFGFGADSLGNILRWNLLPSSQIILAKTSYEINRNQILFYNNQIVDVVRWGGYRPKPDPYPQNQPAGSIPEFWSLARYNNVHNVDPLKESTKSDFYMTQTPIPGWYSQLSR